MKWSIWIFGLISGAILSAMMLVTMSFQDEIGTARGEIIGYSTMVLAFLLIYFGVRSYRDTVGGGRVSFGRALAVGLVITAIASACYTVTWEALYFGTKSDFAAKYEAYEVQKARASGASQAAIDKKVAEMRRFAELYQNPFYNSAVTFAEPLPVGVVIALLSAILLSRKRREPEAQLATA